jgi:predicted aspartyl protease
MVDPEFQCLAWLPWGHQHKTSGWANLTKHFKMVKFIHQGTQWLFQKPPEFKDNQWGNCPWPILVLKLDKNTPLESPETLPESIKLRAEQLKTKRTHTARLAAVFPSDPVFQFRISLQGYKANCLLSTEQQSAFVDTGCTGCHGVVSSELVSKFKLPVTPVPAVEVKLADGTAHTAVHTAKLKMKLHGHHFEVPCLVLPVSSDFPVMLGQNFLLQNKVILDYEHKVLKFKKKGVQHTIRPFKPKADKSPKSAKQILVEDTVLDQTEATVQPGKISRGDITSTRGCTTEKSQVRMTIHEGQNDSEQTARQLPGDFSKAPGAVPTHDLATA